MEGNKYFFTPSEVHEEVNNRIFRLKDLSSQLESKELCHDKFQEKIKHKKMELLKKQKEIELQISHTDKTIADTYYNFLVGSSDQDVGSSDQDVVIGINLLRDLIEGKMYEVKCREREVEVSERKLNETYNKLSKEEVEKYEHINDRSVYDTETHNSIVKANQDYDKIQNINFEECIRDFELAMSKPLSIMKDLKDNRIILKNTSIISNLKLMEMQHDYEILNTGDFINQEDFSNTQAKRTNKSSSVPKYTNIIKTEPSGKNAIQSKYRVCSPGNVLSKRDSKKDIVINTTIPNKSSKISVNDTKDKKIVKRTYSGNSKRVTKKQITDLISKTQNYIRPLNTVGNEIRKNSQRIDTESILKEDIVNTNANLNVFKSRFFMDNKNKLIFKSKNFN